MTPSEFKAWFDGFCEGMDGPPTADQFERIKKQIASIGPEWPSPRDNFVPSYRPSTGQPPLFHVNPTCSATSEHPVYGDIK